MNPYFANQQILHAYGPDDLSKMQDVFDQLSHSEKAHLVSEEERANLAKAIVAVYDSKLDEPTLMAVALSSYFHEAQAGVRDILQLSEAALSRLVDFREIGLNLLLQSLPEDELAALQPHFERVELKLGQILADPKTPIEHVFFPIDGICSVIAVNNNGIHIEAGLIGREGFHGASVLLRVDHSAYQVIVQGAGRALKISVKNLIAATRTCETLNTVLLRFLHTFHLQTAHTSLANGHYKVEQRLARWLLMYQDRLGAVQIPITHEFLSLMLAVRRSSVTEALHLLEGKHVIRSTRGQVKIVSRAGLEEVAAGSYGTPEEEYERLICPMRKPDRHEYDPPQVEH